MIESRTTRSFRAAFAALPEEIQTQARRAYRIFRANPGHASLRFKKVDPLENVYSVRVGHKRHRKRNCRSETNEFITHEFITQLVTDLSHSYTARDV